MAKYVGSEEYVIPTKGRLRRTFFLKGRQQPVVSGLKMRKRTDSPPRTASPYDTNLAAEFHVLSILHRLGADASLTLGNKKAVDIAIVRGAGRAITVDVKGVAGRHDWPADNVRIPEHGRHFLVLVSFEGQIVNPSSCPSVWVVPARRLGSFMRKYRVRKVISRAAIKDQGRRYRDAWHLLTANVKGR